MAKTGLLLTSIFLALTTYSQGTVDFNNYTQHGGQGAPIYMVGESGIRGPGPALVAGLFVNGSFVGTTAFACYPLDTLLVPTVITVPGIPGGSSVTFEVKFWDPAFGKSANSYDLATAANALRGTTGPFSGVLGGGGDPPGPPSNLDNMTSVSLFAPSSWPPEAEIQFQNCDSSIHLFWREPSPFTLQANSSLDPNGWTNYGGAITREGNIARIDIDLNDTHLFFRLAR